MDSQRWIVHRSFINHWDTARNWICICHPLSPSLERAWRQSIIRESTFQRDGDETALLDKWPSSRRRSRQSLAFVKTSLAGGREENHLPDINMNIISIKDRCEFSFNNLSTMIPTQCNAYEKITTSPTRWQQIHFSAQCVQRSRRRKAVCPSCHLSAVTGSSLRHMSHHEEEYNQDNCYNFGSFSHVLD